MTSPVLVTGGTGTLGRLVVARLRDTGCDVRVLSRRHHEATDGVEFITGDLATGEGIEPAVDGAGTIVHCAAVPRATRTRPGNLMRAASRAGVSHVVYISVVGADRIPVVSRVDRAMFGYFGSKLAAEQIVAASGVPWTTLRAAQFHDLTLMVAQQMAKLPIIPVPAGFRVQPVDAGDVAARLVELALGKPAGLVPDMGGPRVYRVADLLHEYLQAARRHRPIVSVRLPGKAAVTRISPPADVRPARRAAARGHPRRTDHRRGPGRLRRLHRPRPGHPDQRPQLPRHHPRAHPSPAWTPPWIRTTRRLASRCGR